MQSSDTETKQLKDCYLVIESLSDIHKNLDDADRALADEVISEWALSEDERLRFDALALIDDLRIVKAVPTLRSLIDHLKLSNAPSAPDE